MRTTSGLQTPSPSMSALTKALICHEDAREGSLETYSTAWHGFAAPPDHVTAMKELGILRWRREHPAKGDRWPACRALQLTRELKHSSRVKLFLLDQHLLLRRSFVPSSLPRAWQPKQCQNRAVYRHRSTDERTVDTQGLEDAKGIVEQPSAMISQVF